jgi:thiol:disulfide interchange protein
MAVDERRDGQYLFNLFMKRPILFALGFFLTLLSKYSAAQDSAANAVSWEFSGSMKPGDPLAGPHTMLLKARILPGWRLYSTTMPDSLPYTRVGLDSATSAFARIVSIEEKGKLESKKDPLFGNAPTQYFEREASFLVRVQGNGGVQLDPGARIKGSISYMARLGDSVIGPLEVPFYYYFAKDGNLIVRSTALRSSAPGTGDLKRSTIDLANPVAKCGGTGAEDSKSKGLLDIFILGFIGGLIGLIMPCTFPMIPLTVSFFTKRSDNRSKGIFNAFLYGFFIFLIYVLISLPFYFLKANDAGILNDISTNTWLNISFALVFLVFALSFFGLFEITLPGDISNSVDARSGIGSIGGIFFMALTLAVVSFSCTGPILGTLLVGAFNQGGGAVQLTVAMAGFGLALGLPFALFALFPNWLQRLPRSGAWMNTVKIVFGFVELALAFKYFSNADLVNHWGLLKREIFIGLWILIASTLVLYLFGVIRFSHDPPPKKLGRPRILIALIFLAFDLYMTPGLTNTRSANLSLLSGIVPPLNYSVYKSEKGVTANFVNNYDKALELARQQHKPVLIDFTGWNCANCRRMEENVWTAPEVSALIKNDYILVSLYVDDRQRLPDDQQFLFTTSDGSKKEIRTVGDKFQTFQSANFKEVAQPLYVVITPDEKLMTYPVAYTKDPKAYAAWLQCGLDAYKRYNGQ